MWNPFRRKPSGDAAPDPESTPAPGGDSPGISTPAEQKSAAVSDHAALQGLWRVDDIRRPGPPLLYSVTHYLVEGDRVKLISPSELENDNWSTFVLDPTANPRRFTLTTERPGADGTLQRTTQRWLYELQGETLRLAWPDQRKELPEAISEEQHTVVIFLRDPGPPPACKQPSGKRPLQDGALGTVTWDDRFDQWEAQVELQPDHAVTMTVDPAEELDDTAAVELLRDMHLWLRQCEPEARQFAAAELLELHNDTWSEEDEETTAEEFVERMTLTSVSVYSDGSAELYYADGDLFWGHTILISVNEDRTFEDASIAG